MGFLLIFYFSQPAINVPLSVGMRFVRELGCGVHRHCTMKSSIISVQLGAVLFFKTQSVPEVAPLSTPGS